MTREAQAHEERRKTLHDIVELAAKFFEATLASRAGARGRGYLADRGINPSTQLKFRLGYAPAPNNTRSRSISARRRFRSRTWWRQASSSLAKTSRCPTTASATA